MPLNSIQYLLLSISLFLCPVVSLAQSETQNTTGNYWKLRGNAGTVAAGNFIGTTDNVALSFRLNNLWAGRLDHINNNYSIGPASLSSNPTGIRNVGFGNGTLFRNTTGFQNVAFGNYGLFNNTSGNYNTAVGDDAANRNITGTGNTAIGQGALYRDTLGNNNVVVGRLAMFNNYSGSNNTVLGADAGANNNGSSNIFIGRLAGAAELGDNKLYIENSASGNPLIYGDFVADLVRINGLLNINNAYSLPTADGSTNNVLTTNGSGTVSWANPATLANAWNLTGNSGTNPTTNFIGTSDAQPISFKINNNWAGRWINSSGNYSVGYISLSNITSGTFNVGFGAYALATTTQGNYNSGYGANALEDNTVGNNNTAVGRLALRRNISGDDNTAVGEKALNNSTYGISNVAVGQSALFTNITGSNNTALGQGALYSNTASNNTAVGQNALYTNSTGTGNAALGQGALYTNNGANNVAFGPSSLYSNSAGSNNVAIGTSAGYSATGGGNAFLGFQAGYSNTGSNNTFVGTASGYNNAGSGNIFLGSSAGTNETGSNKLYIENSSSASPLIYGDFSTDIVRVYGKLGIGVNPVREIDVVGDIDASNNVYAGTNSLSSMAFGSATTITGTIGSSGFSRLTNGMIMQWATIQLIDNGGVTPVTWTYPQTFPNGVMSITATNASRAAGQTAAGQVNAIPGVGTSNGTSAQLWLRNTGTVGTLCWVTVMAIGW